MFDGMTRRIMSIWFPRLPSDRALRAHPVAGPFALILKEQNAERIYCLNKEAKQYGLYRGMSYADARAFCPDLQSRPADVMADRRFLHILCQFAQRYCPWVGLEGRDGLVLDITGAAHLFGGEEVMLANIGQRLARVGILARIGLGDSRGAAWALAHYGEGIAEPGAPLKAIGMLPVAALRLDEDMLTSLQRLGLRTIADLLERPRAPLARRFGPLLLMRLDQALGIQAESIIPVDIPLPYAVRLSFPEPIGLLDDVMAGARRLLDRLCQRLERDAKGARILSLSLRRVDQESQQVELRLARPLRDPARLVVLFEKGLSKIDAGFGIDQMRLEAVQITALQASQISTVSDRDDAALGDLITRIGTRIGLENIHHFLPADSHIPERSFYTAPAAYSKRDAEWTALSLRPLRLFPPEAIAASGPRPPKYFRWRRMSLQVMRSTGPERIMPEWWLEDENWHLGMRDYWRVETKQGRRLWLFHTPQNPSWFVQGEFA